MKERAYDVQESNTILTQTQIMAGHVEVSIHVVVRWENYGWPFLSIPQTLTATSNFEDGFI